MVKKEDKSIDLANKRAVRCPICDVSDFDVKYYKNQKHSQIVRCRHCKLLYSNPQVDVLDYYVEDSPYHNFYTKYIKGRYKTFEHKFNIINNFIKKGRLLDIGCGSGVFLDIANKHGWHVEGIELNRESIEWARKRFEFTLYEDSFEKIDPQQGSYDLISLFSIFEHLKDPIEALKKIYYLLKPKGYIIIEIPNIETIQARIFGDLYYHFIYAHYWYFSKAHITRLLKKWNFNIVYFGYATKYFQLNYILHYSSHYFIKNNFSNGLTNKIITAFNKKLRFDPIIKIPLRDDYIIVAQKNN